MPRSHPGEREDPAVTAVAEVPQRHQERKQQQYVNTRRAHMGTVRVGLNNTVPWDGSVMRREQETTHRGFMVFNFQMDSLFRQENCYDALDNTLALIKTGIMRKGDYLGKFGLDRANRAEAAWVIFTDKLTKASLVAQILTLGGPSETRDLVKGHYTVSSQIRLGVADA